MHSHGLIMKPGILITTNSLGESQTLSTSILSSKKCEFSKYKNLNSGNEFLTTHHGADKLFGFAFSSVFTKTCLQFSGILKATCSNKA